MDSWTAGGAAAVVIGVWFLAVGVWALMCVLRSKLNKILFLFKHSLAPTVVEPPDEGDVFFSQVRDLFSPGPGGGMGRSDHPFLTHNDDVYVVARSGPEEA